MNAPLLSICIATRNRCDLLAQTVNEFLRQSHDFPIEIVVVDGASTDGTTAWLKIAEGAASGRLRYETLLSNGGIDRDYNHCVEIAKGRFCWLFSDDDLPLPGAIEKLVAYCANNKYDFIYVDAEIWCKDMNNKLVSRRLKASVAETQSTGDLNRLFVWTAAQLCFIGSCVVRREFWLSRDRKSYFGSYFAHVAVVFQAALERHALVVSEPLIKIRAGNASWSVHAAEIWMVLWPSLLWSMSTISEDSKRQVSPRYPWRKPVHLAWLRAKGQYSWQHYRNVVCKHEPSVYHLIVPGLLALVPAALFSVAAIFFVRIYKPENHYLLYEVIASRQLPAKLLRLVLRSSWRSLIYAFR
jgi:abequosyltransferase